MDQVNFPYHFHDEDYVSSVYNDRIPFEKWRELQSKHFSANAPSLEFEAPDREKMMALLEEYFGRKLTGYRIVRYTSVSSGYPVWRFDVFAKSEKTPEEKIFTGLEGENVETLDGMFYER